MSRPATPLDEAIRRNRQRVIVITAVATFNYLLVVTILVLFFGWGLVYWVNSDADIPFGVVIGSSVAVGALIGVTIVSRKVRFLRPRTIGALMAVPIESGEFPRVENILAELAVATGSPPVHAALLADPAPNALAVGHRPSETTIVVTSGLVELLTRDELEAVLAVELCAVRRLDTVLQTVAVACTAGAIAAHRFFRDDWKDPRGWIWIAATWPSMAFAELVRRWALRSCDFGADAMAVSITRHPEALARALEKLGADPQEVEVLSHRTAALWFEPLPHDDKARAGEFRNLVFTPSLGERITRLRSA